jgi:SAM-dependent methyltransferase
MTKTRQEKFTEVYQKNIWGGSDSVSGTGSDLGQTTSVREILPKLLAELGARTFLDAPCGDLHWIRTVDLGVEYIGVDIVQELVDRLRIEFPQRRFECCDLVESDLPRADLIFCRDCLVHLPLEEVRKVLTNFVRSGATWLLTTTFPAVRVNKDVKWSGWRPLNLQAAPFGLPKPARLINEGCTEEGGKYADKSLGLWRLDELGAFAG